MALTFNGSTSLVATTGTVATALNGAAAGTVAAWVKFTSTTSTNSLTNRVLSGIIDAGGAGTILNLDNSTVGGEVRLRGSAKSQVADSLQGVYGDTNLASGTWYHLAAVFDYTGDAITVYVNGVQDGTGAVTFGSSTFSPGTPSSGDSIPGSSAYLTGSIADLAIWNTDIGVTSLARLAAGERPTRVSPSSLRVCLPLQSSSKEIIAGATMTNSGGTPTAGAHPAKCKPLFSGAGCS